MIAGDFITRYVYSGLTQKGVTMMYTQQNILDYVNLALNDIYSFEWRNWSFMFEELDFDVDGSADTFIHSTPEPIIRIHSVFDKKSNAYVTSQARSFGNVQRGEFAYKMHKKEIKVWDKGETTGYKVEYLHWFNRLESISDVIPVPDSFFSALYAITMAYAYPAYGQFGEGKDVQQDRKGYERLSELAKTDTLQLQSIKTNIR